LKIRALVKKDYGRVIEIALMLGHKPDMSGWFTKDAHDKHIPFDIRVHKGFVAEDGANIVGFITYSSYDFPPRTPYISWIAVDPEYHRQGVGSKLVANVEKEILSTGVKELYVETPTKEEGIGSDYEKTYKFYEGAGFQIHRIKKRDSPDNNCDCDMAILRKVLG
jgi:ribosomal protein S18 acetylase RimI-like enzyme